MNLAKNRDWIRPLASLLSEVGVYRMLKSSIKSTYISVIDKGIATMEQLEQTVPGAKC